MAEPPKGGSSRGSSDGSRRGDTRFRILEAARRLAQREGLSAVTVGAVAAEANVFKAAVAYHFGSKAGLLASLATATFDEIDERVATAARRCPPGRERVSFIAQQWLGFSKPENDLAFYDVLGYALRKQELHAQLRDFYQRWTDLIQELLMEDSGIGETEARELALALRMLIDGMAVERLVSPEHGDWKKAGQSLERLAEVYAHAEGRGDTS